MPEESSCWVCHRSEAEISAFADVVTPQEREILQQVSQVTRFKTDFIQSADAWKKGVPKEFKEFDFIFVTSNPDQFKSIRILNGLLGEIVAPSKLLGEIGEAKKLTFDWLESVAPILRKGDGEVPGFGPLSRLDKADRDLLRRMVEQFEAKWRRRIGSDGSGGAGSNGYGSGLEGLKLLEGLDFLIAVGILYYDLQAQLLDMAKRKEMSSKEKRGISVLHVSGYPPVPLCSVCLDLFTELGSHSVQVATQHVIAPSARERLSRSP